VTTDAIVFVVDDDESVRKALARLIGSVGLEVRTFPSPAAFLAHPRPDRPACVILDLRMPGTSGLTLQEELAQAGVDLPILFLTGHADVSTSVRAMKAGAVDFLEKPLHDQALLDAIHRALGHARELRGARAEREGIARRVASLTPREREVLALVVAGLPNKLVADRLGASEKTIKVHRARVMQKMHADSLAHLVRMAQVVGIGASGTGATS
jgi:FixJ family two-component response regulator